MTPPFSAPAAAAKPPAGTPRAQGAPTAAGVPRPTMASNGNHGAPVVRVTPRVQAPSTARIPPGVPMNATGATFPAARPRMPLAPHAQGAPTEGVPRPMANFGGGAQMTAAPSPAPRMQPGSSTARTPCIPPNARAVGAAVQYANPAAPSPGKRAPTAMGPAPVPAAKRHAPMPGPQGAAPMGGVTLPRNPAVAVRAAVPPGHAAPSMPPPLPKLTYVGVYRDPSKGWMARAMDLKRRAARSIGPFDDPHQAALAHDRAALACAGRGVITAKQLNFPTSFYRVETAFLQRWEGDVCDAVESGEYEKIYARFLRAGFRAAMNIKEGDEGGEQTTDELIAGCVGDGGFFWDDIENFFIYRAGEIGEEALGDEAWEKDGQGRGRELLQNRFVEMHRNKSLSAVWRRKNYMEKMKTMMMQNQQRQQQQIQMQQPQQQQIQMQQQQQQVHLQQQQQIHMQQQQQQIQMQQQRRQQQFQQHQMMIQKQHQQQLMMAQQQEQQCLDHDAICSLDSGEIVNNQIE